MRRSIRLWLAAWTIAASFAAPLRGQDSSASRALKILENAKQSIPDSRGWTYAKSTLLQAIAIAQARAGDAQAAELTFQEILQAAPKHARNVAIAKARAGNIKAAIVLAETLKDGSITERRDALSGESTSRIGSLRTDALETIVDLLLESKRWKDALLVVHLLPETKRGGHPNGQTAKQEALKKVAVAQARAGDPQAALLTAKGIASHYYKELALQEIVAAQVKRGELNAALQSVEEITSSSLKLSSYLGIATGQAEAGDTGGAAATFLKARTLASGLVDISVRPSSRVRALTKIAEAQLLVEDPAGAHETMKMAMDGSDELDLYTIALGQARLGAIHLAETKADSIQVPWRRIGALIGISRVLAQAGDRAKAKELCLKARSIAQATKDDTNRSRSLFTVGKGQLEARDVSGALKSARDMLGSYKWDLLQLIVKSQVATGDFRGARTTADLITVDWMKYVALHDVALALARAGDSEAATELAASFEGTIRQSSLEEISSILLDRGEIEQALKTVQRMENMNSAARTLRNIAAAQVGNGDEAGTLAWIYDKKGHLHKAYALLGVAEGILKTEGRNR